MSLPPSPPTSLGHVDNTFSTPTTKKVSMNLYLYCVNIYLSRLSISHAILF